MSVLALALGALVPAIAHAGPQGEQVVAGSADFERNGGRTHITAADGTIINFDSFNIGMDEAVRFIQPGQSARVLNRVTNGAMTTIDGSLTANGQVYIANPAGIFFGGNAVVNVGDLTAVGGNINNQDFLEGVDRFDLTGSVTNEGLVRGRNVRMLGSQVTNRGTIRSDDGLVLLAAGEEVFLADGDSPVFAKVSEGEPQTEGAAVTQAGEITAGEGAAQFAAGDHYAVAVHHTGHTEARDVHVHAPARQVQIAGSIYASDTTLGKGGDVTVEADRIVLSDAKIDASGPNGGGNVRIGGDRRGEGQINTADYTLAASDVNINADATETGDGGEVIVFAEKTAVFNGTISARGGSQAGDGGFIEVSGLETLVQNGTYRLAAPHGQAGTLLFDPLDIIIRPGIDDGSDRNAFQNGFSESEELASEGGGFGDINFTDFEGGPSPFVVFESEIEGEFVTTSGNIVLEARRSIRAEGTFEGAIEVDTNVLNNDNRPAPSGIGITMRTRNNSSDGAGEIDLEPATFTVANGATITIAGSTSGEQASNITLGGLNSDGGTIDVSTQVGNVTLTDAITTSTSNGNGDVTIVTDDGGITMNDTASIDTDGGEVTMTATEATGLGGPIETGGGAITIQTNDDITFDNAEADLTSAGGAINLSADNDGDDDGLLTMDAGTVIDAEDGNITLNAGEDIALGRLTTTGDVSATSTAGAVTDANDPEDGAAVSNIDAANLDLSAVTGLGEITDFTAAEGDALELNITNAINTLEATGTGSDVFVDLNASSLPANPIEVGGTGVGSAIVALDGDADISSGLGNFFTLTAGDNFGIISGGTLTLPDAGLNQPGSDIILQGNTDVLDASGRELDITAENLFIDSGNAGGAVTVNTDVTALNAIFRGAGTVTVNETDTLAVTRLATDDSDIDLTTGGNTSLGIVDAGTGNVTVDAGGLILDADGKIIGDLLMVDAAGAAVLDTTVNTIDASTTASGNLIITETDDVTLSDVDTNDGAITVTAGGAITPTDVASLTDTAGNDISLTGEGNMAIGTIQAGTNGNVTLNAGNGAISDADATFNQQVTGDIITALAGGGIVLDASASTINANSTNAGDVIVRTDTTLDAEGIAANNGNVTVTTTGGGSDLNVNQDIVAGHNGLVTLNSGNAVIDNGGRIIGGELTGTSGGAATLDMTVETLGYTAGGDLSVTSDQGFALNAAEATGSALTINTAGGITDNNGAAVNLTGDTLQIDAETTIGQITDFINGAGDALEANITTQVDGLTLTEPGGAIFIDLGASTPALADAEPDIDGAADLILRADGNLDAGPLLGAINITAGDRIGLISGGTLTISDPLNAPPGTAALLLRGDTNVTDGDNTLEINSPVLSFFSGSGGTDTVLNTTSDQITARLTGAGNLTINEQAGGGALRIDAAGTNDGTLTITTTDGPLTVLNADTDTNGPSDMTLTSGDGDLTVGALNTTGATLNLGAPAGGIVDADGKLLATNLIAGADGDMVLDTDVDSIDASATGTGDITISERDAVELIDVDTNDGDITATSGGETTLVDVNAGNRTATINADTAIQGTGGGATDVQADVINLNAPNIGTTSRVELTAGSAFNATGNTINIQSIGDLPVGLVNAGTGGNVDLLGDANIDSVTDDFFPDIVGGTVTLQGTFIGANSPLDVLGVGTVNATATDGSGTVAIDFQLGNPNVINITAPGGSDVGLEILTNITEQLPAAAPDVQQVTTTPVLNEPPAAGPGLASLDQADFNQGFGRPDVGPGGSLPVRPVADLGGVDPTRFADTLADSFARFVQYEPTTSLVDTPDYNVVDLVTYLKFGRAGESGEAMAQRRAAYRGLRDLARNLQQQGLFGLGQRAPRMEALEPYRPDGMTPGDFELLVDIIGLEVPQTADAGL